MHTILKNKMIQSERELDNLFIAELITEHDVAYYQKLQDYYNAESNILRDPAKESYKPDNRLVANYPSYITDLMTGYCTGKPVNYTSENDTLMEVVSDIFDINDEQDENSELDKVRSIKGLSYELVYTDEDGNIRFNKLDPENTIAVYDNKIVPEMRFAIRFYESDDINYVELYDKEYTTRYIRNGTSLDMIEQVQHFANEVPVIEYKNNNELTGDFEKVMTLIDAYDKLQSTTLNDMELLADAYLVLEGMQSTTEQDLVDMREQRAFLPPPDGKAYYLTKDINDTALENMKNRLNADIHKFSKVIDVTDENFAGNSTGVAMKYKLLALEQVVAMKERKFKRGLQKRLRLICNYLNLKGGNYDYRDISIQFTRNLPVNELEEVEIVTKLKGIVSDKTALSRLSWIDVNRELELIEQEREVYADQYPDSVQQQVTDEIEEEVEEEIEEDV